MNADFTGKVALIGGAGPAIGASCARMFAEAGADVVLAARSADRLETMARELAEATGRRVIGIATDMGNVDECTALVDETVQKLGRIDAVVNIATAHAPHRLVSELSWDDYQLSVSVNIVGTMEITRRAAHHMAEQESGGSIVQISTLNTHSLQKNMSAYSSTKLAMVTMSKVLAKEMGPKGVRVNIVTPGYTETDGLLRYFAEVAERTGSDVETVSANAARASPLRRHVQPDDIAAAVVFLSSELARNITGHEIPVDAGAILGP